MEKNQARVGLNNAHISSSKKNPEQGLEYQDAIYN